MKSELKTFRKKPVVIQAQQAMDSGIIHTLEGDMRYEPGDWIITGIKGEQYPCKPDIFEATYEPAENTRAVTPTGELAKRLLAYADWLTNPNHNLTEEGYEDLRQAAAALQHQPATGELVERIERLQAGLGGFENLDNSQRVELADETFNLLQDIIFTLPPDGAVVLTGAEQLALAMDADNRSRPALHQTLNGSILDKAEAIYAKLKEAQDGN